MKRTILASLLVFFACLSLCFAAGYPEKMVERMMGLKADAEAGKEMPATIDGLPIIGSEDAYKLFKEKKAVFLDNRVKTQFDTEKITGAEWFFCDTLLKDPALADKLDKSKEYIVYCNGVLCWRSPAVGLMLKHLGFAKVHWYRDGLPDWKKKAFPTE
jgi:rhodanese-related sulfurtransferase